MIEVIFIILILALALSAVLGGSPKCPRCGSELEDTYHTLTREVVTCRECGWNSDMED